MLQATCLKLREVLINHTSKQNRKDIEKFYDKILYECNTDPKLPTKLLSITIKNIVNEPSLDDCKKIIGELVKVSKKFNIGEYKTEVNGYEVIINAIEISDNVRGQICLNIDKKPLLISTYDLDGNNLNIAVLNS